MSIPKPRIALTLGDLNGIGPEVLLKCLHDPTVLRTIVPVVVGSATGLRAYAEAVGFGDTAFHACDTPPKSWPDDGIVVLEVAKNIEFKPKFGQVAQQTGRLAMQAVEHAIQLCRNHTVAAMVTAPISKEAVALAGYQVPGHTEFLAQKTKSQRVTMMLVTDELRVALLTGHIPLHAVAEHITQEAILTRLQTVKRSLRYDFGIDRPRIAVLGLNPHAGDGGVIGTEESEVIQPALDVARAQDVLAFGPFPADGFFANRTYRGYDAVLALYHDQGLIPFKTLAFHHGVNVTAGLPIVRTSPDHGTAFDIAGQGIAGHESMREAIWLAAAIAQRRNAKKGKKSAAA